MKLLVLAQTPPPLHGQSFMVQSLVEGLPAQGVQVRHVNLRLSRDTADIGRWRFGKVASLFRVAWAARRMARRESCDALYYVPAPGKRGAWWRDAFVLRWVRSACPRLVLHFHAAGLGDWLAQHASAAERRAAERALAGADLAFVLADALRADARALRAQRVEVVANGIPDPCAAGRTSRPERRSDPATILFLGACTPEKGALVLLQAVQRLAQTGVAVRAVFAGMFAHAEQERVFRETAAPLAQQVEHVGFVTGEAKQRLFASSDVFCLPTFYPHEAQPLVLLEALAHDLPIVATNWRGIPETLPAGNPLVPPGDPVALASALAQTLRTPPAPGVNRAHFLAHFTREIHLARVAEHLRTLS